MRRIERGDPPLPLTLMLGVEPDKEWSSSGIPDVVDAIRERLRVLQDGLCAYCESPLEPPNWRVEHIHPRALNPCMSRMSPNHHFDWTNLLLVCAENGTCDEAKLGKHLCEEIVFPDTIGPGLNFAFDTLTGQMSASEALPHDEFDKTRNAIVELRLDDPDLRTRRRAVIFEVQRRIIQEGEPPNLVRFEMLPEGFPTTVEFACSNLD